MALISKLNATKYPMVPLAEIGLYLTFSAGINKDDIDPVFLQRLAAFVKAEGKGNKMNINSGSRTIASQAKIFLSRGGKYDAKLGYYWPDSVPANKRTVAKPGKSFHNFALAIDTDSEWAKAINKVEATSKQSILLKYGIFKPMTAGNKSSVLESWHAQPIETLNVPLEKRAALAPTGWATK